MTRSENEPKTTLGRNQTVETAETTPSPAAAQGPQDAQHSGQAGGEKHRPLWALPSTLHPTQREGKPSFNN